MNQADEAVPEEPMDEMDRLMEQMIDRLIEHCDAVTVFVQKRNGPDTEGKTMGRGNYWARVGQIKDWLLREEERAKLEVKHNFESDL
jgi:hypothetical protein